MVFGVAMADSEGQRRLEDLMNDVNFPMPGAGDIDLDFDFDFDSSQLAKAGLGSPSTPRDNILDQQYGAVAALATQGAVMRPVADPGPQSQQQDWQMMHQPGNPGEVDYTFCFQSPPLEHGWKGPKLPRWEEAPPPTSHPLGHSLLGDFDDVGPSAPAEPGACGDPFQEPFQEPARAHSKPDSGDSSEPKAEELDAQAKAERTKAKNKRAQKKFRQKQKERHEELERSAAELSAKLKATLADLDALQSQKRVLEIALSREADPLASRAAEEKVPEEPIFIPAQGSERFSPKAGILLEVVFDPPKKLTHKQALHLSLRDHTRLWKELCRQAKELLQSGADDPESPAGKKLRALINERHGLLAWTSVNNPVIIHKLMTSKLVDPPEPDNEPPGPAFWRQILEELKLTPQQQAYLLEARAIYLKEMGRLMKDRLSLQANLKALDAGLKTAPKDKAKAHLQWADVVNALQENVDAFHICHCVFMASIYSRAKGLSVVQEASLTVQSFPHAPDIFATLKELAELTGHPSVPDTITQDTPVPEIKTAVQDTPQEPVSLRDKLESAISAANADFIEKLG